MPSEARSLRRWTRIDSAPARLPPVPLLLLALALLVSGSAACASNSQPQALASTRDALAELDEFGALLLGAGAGSFEMGVFYTRDERDNWQRVDSPTSAPSL
jgi:hypothetical protein